MESTVLKPFLGTALTLHSSALSCGDGWRWVVALDGNYQNYSILMRLVKHFKNLANTLQTVMGDHSTAAHPL